MGWCNEEQWLVSELHGDRQLMSTAGVEMSRPRRRLSRDDSWTTRKDGVEGRRQTGRHRDTDMDQADVTDSTGLARRPQRP